MSNYGKQHGTSAEERIVITNPNLFRVGMNFVKKDNKIIYSFGVKSL